MQSFCVVLVVVSRLSCWRASSLMLPSSVNWSQLHSKCIFALNVILANLSDEIRTQLSSCTENLPTIYTHVALLTSHWCRSKPVVCCSCSWAGDICMKFVWLSHDFKRIMIRNSWSAVEIFYLHAWKLKRRIIKFVSKYIFIFIIIIYI